VEGYSGAEGVTLRSLKIVVWLAWLGMVSMFPLLFGLYIWLAAQESAGWLVAFWLVGAVCFAREFRAVLFDMPPPWKIDWSKFNNAR
jgi:hypothetical protein